MTVRDLARHMAAHDINHILQIERLLRDEGRTQRAPHPPHQRFVGSGPGISNHKSACRT